MAKGCLEKLTGNLLTTCDLEALGVLDLYLIYPEDVTLTLSESNRQVSAIAFTTGAKSYRVEGYKQNIQITSSLLSTDVSDRNDISITFKVPAKMQSMWSAIQSGKFYVLEVPANQVNFFALWGINAPLVCTGFEYDSNSNGRMATVTLSAPEGSAGNHRCYCSAAVKDSIIAKSA